MLGLGAHGGPLLEAQRAGPLHVLLRDVVQLTPEYFRHCVQVHVNALEHLGAIISSEIEQRPFLLYIKACTLYDCGVCRLIASGGPVAREWR